ncbi:DUF6714 family protein [Simiduia agarivorans]|uniref:Uncharacterized protein n=1 Tax=Simiduia agarivorans (strain DSM 21679 / JCM 13881 / BCRC 17597 / SA1) TaxID=1117647 RepID=K4KRA4_SIMAS|nr:DUF6714 family protein [Simiduia agarivorans]AFV00811.1 hypothetical protein M5M_18410 [Simiduia agarivorans SA1 = DSM 21679]
MKYYNLQDIDEMKRNGFEKKTIEEAYNICEQVSEVVATIESAFAGVTLGAGIGLMEAQVIDDYGDAAQRRAARENDEKYAWQSLSPMLLNKCHSSLSFFDAQGMRFHLPAFMILHLQGGFYFNIVFYLTEINDWAKEKFSLLNARQRSAVRDFLNYLVTTEEHRHEALPIADALLGYWCESRD